MRLVRALVTVVIAPVDWYAPHGRMRRRTYWLFYKLPFYPLLAWAYVADLRDLRADPTRVPTQVILFLVVSAVPMIGSFLARMRDLGVDGSEALWPGGPFGSARNHLRAAFQEGVWGPNDCGPDPKAATRGTPPVASVPWYQQRTFEHGVAELHRS